MLILVRSSDGVDCTETANGFARLVVASFSDIDEVGQGRKCRPLRIGGCCRRVRLDTRLRAVDGIEDEVELELEDEKLLADIEEAADYRERCKVSRVQATRLLSDVVVGGEKASNASTGGLSHTEVRLPKLELPIFEGEVVQWPAFWDQFEAMVDNSELPDVSKFVYLRSLLKGEALSAINGLTLSSQHYIIAKDNLRDRFGRKERIIFAHIQQLMQLRVNQTQSSKTTHLMRLQDELVTHVRSLEALGVNGDQYGIILTPLILCYLKTSGWSGRVMGKATRVI